MLYIRSVICWKTFCIDMHDFESKLFLMCVITIVVHLYVLHFGGGRRAGIRDNTPIRKLALRHTTLRSFISSVKPGWPGLGRWRETPRTVWVGSTKCKHPSFGPTIPSTIRGGVGGRIGGVIWGGVGGGIGVSLGHVGWLRETNC